MIKIKRHECPRRLSNSQASSYDNLSQPIKDDTASSLWKMQKRKCCYCERYIPEKGHLRGIDHFRPQALFPSLDLDWDNLLLACSQCNGKKSQQFPVNLAENKSDPNVIWLDTRSTDDELHSAPAIIDPTNDSIDPEEHIGYKVDIREGDFGLVFAKIQDPKRKYLGQNTGDVVGLFESYHHRLRKTRIWLFYQCLISLQAAVENDESEISIRQKKDTFVSLMSATSDYAALARELGRACRLDSEFGISIPEGSESA